MSRIMEKCHISQRLDFHNLTVFFLVQRYIYGEIFIKIRPAAGAVLPAVNDRSEGVLDR